MNTRRLAAAAFIGLFIVSAGLVSFAFRHHSREDRALAAALRAGAAPEHRTLTSSGKSRDYWVYRTDSIHAGHAVPLVVVLAAEGFPPRPYADYRRLADRDGVLLAFPITTNEWSDPSDPTFIGDVIHELVSEKVADPSRVYLLGGSWSGIISYRLGCSSFANSIAGIGVFFATIQTPVRGVAGVRQACQPSHPLTIAAIHGTRDPFVPYNGAACAPSDGPGHPIHCQASQAEIMRFWSEFDGCPATPMKSSSGPLEVDVWSPCRQGTAVELSTVSGGSHTVESLTTGGLTPIERIWDFLRNHPGAAIVPFSARVNGVRAMRVGSARTVLASLSVNTQASGRIRLTRGTSVIVAAAFSARPGVTQVRLAVPLRVAAGRYTVRIAVQGAGGKHVRAARTVAVPR